MTTRRPRTDIVFVTHQMTLTGAPLLLLHFARWLHEHHPELSFEVVGMEDGPLVAEFEKLGPTHRFDWHGGYWFWTFIRMIRRFRWGGPLAHRLHVKDFTRRLGELFDTRLIYASSVTTAEFLRFVPYDGPMVTHVHEMAYALEHGQRPEDARRQLERSTRVIACAGAVRRDLAEFTGRPESDFDLVYEYLFREPPPEDYAEREYPRLRERLGLPTDALVVGGSGTLDWRKGADLFAQVAATLRRRDFDRPVYFVWVGGTRDKLVTGQVKHDIRKAGLEDVVRLVETVPDPMAYYAGFDVFALTSREDPFPVVCLETAALRKPIVCFDAGGIPELVAPDAGVVVPYLDVAAFADAVDALLRDPERRARLGDEGRRKVLAGHRIEQLAPQVYEIVSAALGS